MYHLLLCLLGFTFFINLCTGVYVYIEEGKRKAFKTFPNTVMDGYIISTERTIDVLEFRKFDKEETREVTLITNFPNLKYINISSLEMEKIPKFLNLPSAQWLEFSANKLTKIPASAISTLPLIEMSFYGNQISEIEDASFGNNATDVNIDCNLLTEISPKWFKNPEALKILGLAHNRILFIDENLTKYFRNLSVLSLSHNRILSIGNGAFSEVSTMQILNLQGNNVTVLQPEIFGPSINITEFNIGRNHLNFLSKDFLKKLHLKKFVILGNPWQCPCLREIEKWMSLNVNDTTYKTYLLRWSNTNPVCIMASSFSDQCVELVDENLYNSYVENLNIIDDDGVCKY